MSALSAPSAASAAAFIAAPVPGAAWVFPRPFVASKSIPVTAKDSNSLDAPQADIPFGALPESGSSTAKPKRKKAASKKAAAKKPAAKKAAAKKAASKKAATKKPATKKAASKKPATKKAAAKKPASKKKVAPKESADEAPLFEAPAADEKPVTKRAPRRAAVDADQDPRGTESEDSRGTGDGDGEEGGRKRRRTRRGRRRRNRSGEDGEVEEGSSRSQGDAPEGSGDAPRRRAPGERAPGERASGEGHDGNESDRPKRRRRRRRGRKSYQDGDGDREASGDGGGAATETKQERRPKRGQKQRPGRDSSGGDGGEPRPTHGEGMFILDKGQVSVLRKRENQWLPSKSDVYVPKKLVDKYKLHDGMFLKGPLGRGYKHKFQLESVDEIDGQPPAFWKHKPLFKNLTSVDPDFHYAVGDITDDVSMRMVDLLAPIGRGQRGLLVAPPRSGKTTLMRQFAKGIEEGYPDVKLMVLLIDERPEEATEWTRNVTTGEVFASTADETAKHHIQLAEMVWKRAMRLVEMGEDVIILLDSITRLARAYNNHSGGSGRTMSGGLDSRAMERPRKIFGSARNTVEAGSLTILGTTLVDTGSRMDQLVFEEFKGTGNMELVLNRKLADRRIFPAIDIERTGTRKEEKLVGIRRLKLIHVLRRVLARMHFTEAADLLITRLSDVSRTDEFLERFTVDPEA